ncbi:MAG TPA: NADH-quinone oxidoreductase subunit NuoE [Candidatus Limnocylindria bacterium]|nr:NADH-quinone oxidoreductase subunit NuoE [Candidatus Limnocylindria bacterium]
MSRTNPPLPREPGAGTPAMPAADRTAWVSAELLGPVVTGDKIRKEMEQAVQRYPNPRSAILPVLWILQREIGWLPPAALQLAARAVGLPEPEVFGIATFYTMFNLKPVGRHHLQVCMTLSCSLMGADRLFRHLERKLGIGHGETTPDGRFTLRRVECLAACGGGPCMQVNFDYRENVDETQVDRLLETLK